MSKTATAITEHNDEMKGITADVQTRIEKIRSDIRALTNTVAEHGSYAAADVKGQAGAISRDVAKASEEAIAELRKQLDILERDARVKIRENPMAAIGIAAGIGFLAAMLMRR